MTTEIIYKRGNILNEKNFVNTVNLVGVMGAGLAKQVKQQFPNTYFNYLRELRIGNLREGTVFADPIRDDRYIFHVPTKKHWREKSCLELIEKSIEHLFWSANYLRIDNLHTVRLGCGLGGRHWENEVLPLFEMYLPTLVNTRIIVH